MNTYDYHTKNYKNFVILTNQVSDIYCKDIDEKIQNDPIVFHNKLPINIIVLYEKNTHDTIRGPSGQVQKIGEINAQKTLALSVEFSKSVNNGDLFHFMYTKNPIENSPQKNNNPFVPSGNGTGYLYACPSINITKRHGSILVGGVSTYTKTFRRDIHPGGDISSINVHNLLAWPLTIYKDGRKVMYIEPNIYLESPYHHNDMTITPSVYYDNFNLGLNVGTTFEVYMNVGEKLIKLYDFMLNDIDENIILIGNVSPLVDSSVATGANEYITKKQQTGRAIYRIGPDLQVPFNHNIGVLSKNSNQSNLRRTTYSSDKIYTVPSARYPRLSGDNIIKGPYF